MLVCFLFLPWKLGHTGGESNIYFYFLVVFRNEEYVMKKGIYRALAAAVMLTISGGGSGTGR